MHYVSCRTPINSDFVICQLGIQSVELFSLHWTAKFVYFQSFLFHVQFVQATIVLVFFLHLTVGTVRAVLCIKGVVVRRYRMQLFTFEVIRRCGLKMHGIP